MDAAVRKENVRNRIFTEYCPMISAISGRAYSQKLEAFKIIKIQNDPRTQLWIYLNTDILKWMYQGEKLSL